MVALKQTPLESCPVLFLMKGVAVHFFSRSGAMPGNLENRWAGFGILQVVSIITLKVQMDLDQDRFPLLLKLHRRFHKLKPMPRLL